MDKAQDAHVAQHPGPSHIPYYLKPLLTLTYVSLLACRLYKAACSESELAPARKTAVSCVLLGSNETSPKKPLNPAFPFVMTDCKSKKCSILVVDDDGMMRRLLSHSLGKKYEVRTASDGDEALRLILDEPPDLILADIMMPMVDGYDLRTALLQVSCLGCIPFIFVTARYDEKSRAKGLALGADDYITKPFDLSALRNRVQDLVAC